MADVENNTSTMYNGSGGFAKEIGSLVAEGSLNCVCVIQLKENDYLLPTSVLCDYSPVIRDIVCVQRGDTIPRIHIKGIDDKTFQVLMEYMRTGHADVNAQNVIDVYHAASSLQMTTLETICWNKVFEKEPMERSLPAWIAAKRLNMPNEEKQLFRYITHNFDEISKTESFYELDATQVKEILRADVIKAEDELALYKAAINWVHYDCKARSKYASSLVEAIRFQDMTPTQVEAFRAVKVCPEVQKYFDVSQRLPQPGQKKPDKAREYAQVHKVEAGEGAERLPVPPGRSTSATAAPFKPSVPSPPGQTANVPHLVTPPVETPVPKQHSATAVQAAPATQPQAPQKQEQPKPLAAPLVLSIEQQAAVLPAQPEEKPAPKPEVKKDEASPPHKKEESKEKAEVTQKKHERSLKEEAKAAERKKDSPSKEQHKVAPVSEPSLVPKGLSKTKDVKAHGPHEKKKTDSLEKPDAKGDKKGKDKHHGKHGGKHGGKHEADAVSKTATSDVAATPSTVVPATTSEPTSATTIPPSTADSAVSKAKKKESKDKKSKDKKSKSKDKKSKGKGDKKKKKRGFCPWLSSKSSKSSKKSTKGKEKHGGKKSKESASKEVVSRSEAKTTEASKHKLKKDKKGSSKEGSSRSRSKEKSGGHKASKEKAGKGSKEKADKGITENSSKERASKHKHSEDKQSKEKLQSKENHPKDKHGSKEKHRSKEKHGSKAKHGSKEKHGSKARHGSKEKHSKDKRSKEKLSKEKSTSKESKKGGSKEKIKRKHSKEKKPGESKSESVSAGGGGPKREPQVNASRVKKPSAEGPGGGGGNKSDSKHGTPKSHERPSRKPHSESSGNAISSGKDGKSPTVPKRKPDKDRGRSDLGVAGKKSSSGGGHAVHRKARSVNRISSAGGGSDLSLTMGKTTTRNARDQHRQRLSRVPHRALSETRHASDLTSKGNDYASTGDQQLMVALLGGLAADSKGANLESAAIFSYGPHENKWKCVGRMPRPRYGHQAVIHQDYIYVVGGFEVGNDGRQMATAACHRFSLSRSCWETMGSLRRARCHHGVAVVLGKVYAVGGQSVGEGFMDSVEVYDPDLDRWSEVTPLCCARMAANAVEFRGQMYVVGGLMMVPGHKRKVCIVPDTMCFNPMDDTWHHKASLPLPVCNCSLVAHRGRLLAVGGLVRALVEASPSQHPMAPIGDVLEYSPSDDSWSCLSTMPVKAHSVGLASLGEDIYILGGQLADDAGAATRNAYRYNPATDHWVTLPPLPMRLSQACAVTVRRQAFK